MLNIGICGLGLIGGSMAKALTAAGYNVCGYDADAKTLDSALCGGAISSILGAGEIRRQNIIFAALYPDACIEYFMRTAGHIPPSAIVVDLCGVKGHLFDTLSAIAAKGGFSYIGGHPMAGIERSGYSFSSGDMFCGAS
ncbi:MAG: prephenate dehydrogenase/arogenate dehydrogenase family protein, partial [Eubacteriales bacterium]